MKQTHLYDQHIKLGAKMAEYAGYQMPIEYRGISIEHEAVRQHAGVFDVSHMGEIRILGKDAAVFLNDVFTNDIYTMTPHQILYGMLCYPHGGVVDDLLVYQKGENDYLLVVNAANKEKDYAWLVERSTSCSVQIIDESERYDELAVQGPEAQKILEQILGFSLKQLGFYRFDEEFYQGAPILISRTGYTGEDGFEIYLGEDSCKALWKQLVEEMKVEPCGLGARDTLRFEAALPLYGHELSDSISPLEAGLGFAVKMYKDFIGRDALLEQKENGIPRKIVGIELLDRGIPRQGYRVLVEGKEIGILTTGYMVPTSKKPLGLALVKSEYAAIGQSVFIEIRGKLVPAVIRDKKFYEKKYQR